MAKKWHKGLSIKVVTALYSAVVIIAVTTIIVLVGYSLYEKHVMDNYTKYTDTVLEYAYSVVRDYSFGDMIKAREMPESYEEVRAGLNHVKESSDIDYLYAVYFEDINDIRSLTYAINTKTKIELETGGTYTYMGTPCEEGSFPDDTLLILQRAIQIRKRESGVMDGDSLGYGHMFSGYKVIFDSNDDPAGLLCVDIDVNNITNELHRYIRNIVLIVATITLIITVIFVALSEAYVIIPITKLTDAVKDFIRNIGNQNDMDKSVEKLKAMDIHRENEIGELYTAVNKMESGMAKQYKDITQYAENVMKMQDGLIILMADMVENRDSDTGDHIQKTALYVRTILRGLKRKGYYQDELTPQYMEYVEKSAPLHDVGKIRIPDAVLNKPGRLTPEEFEIMKTHTTIGKEIIEKAISTVEGENYLKEARNMAAYHHERWDGKGYPEGLSGEDIPLSARVMAVADVFDALCSKRIYKPALPLEEALKIIEEGKGSQFDPKCVEVFVEDLPNIKTILRKYQH